MPSKNGYKKTSRTVNDDTKLVFTLILCVTTVRCILLHYNY
jgi:hypothetical protein